MKTVAIYNSKGRMGQTSLVYHLTWMFAELGVNVVAIDLDPQSSLTSAFLDDDALEELWECRPTLPTSTIRGVVQPLLDQVGDIAEPNLIEIDRRIRLLSGDLGLSRLEDQLAKSWDMCLDGSEAIATDAFQVTTAFHRIMERAARQHDAELVLIDVGPNVSAINRASLIAADLLVIPLAADLFSLEGLCNLGPVLQYWRDGWNIRKLSSERLASLPYKLPAGEMSLAGYVVLKPSLRTGYPVLGYRRWINRIPAVYHSEMLAQQISKDVSSPNVTALAILNSYPSLKLLAREARKPMFMLKPADGATGGHAAGVHDCYREFQRLAERIAEKCGIVLPRLFRQRHEETALDLNPAG